MSAQQIELPVKPVLPIRASIALCNAARAAEAADRRVDDGIFSANSEIVMQFIAKARRHLDEAEAAIAGRAVS